MTIFSPSYFGRRQPAQYTASCVLLNQWLAANSIRYLAVTILVCTIVWTQAHAAQLRGNPETYRSVLERLKPGDNLLLEPGMYRQGMPLHGLRGTQLQPITIRGPDNGPPALFIGRIGHNTISLSNTTHVRISSLVLDGNNLEVDAIKAEGRKDCAHVHHIVLEDLLIVRHGADQQVVGISSMCPAWNWVIRRNVIVGAGTGLYLGQSDGSAPFVGGLIEQNLIIDTLGYNLQIKHQNERPSGIGMPTEHAQTVIRHNLFSKANNAAPGIHARPNVLLGHFPREGPGSKDIHELTNNVFFCNPVESLIQAEGNLLIAGNIMVNPAGNAVSIQPHNDIPKQVELHRNFIAASGRGVSITNASPFHPQAVANNWLFSPTPLRGGTQYGNRIAPFLVSRASLMQWLATEIDTVPHSKGFAPLLAAASRACSRSANGNLSELPWMQNVPGSHPACKFVDVLATAKRKPESMESDLLGFGGPDRCTWN